MIAMIERYHKTQNFEAKFLNITARTKNIINIPQKGFLMSNTLMDKNVNVTPKQLNNKKTTAILDLPPRIGDSSLVGYKYEARVKPDFSISYKAWSLSSSMKLRASLTTSTIISFFIEPYWFHRQGCVSTSLKGLIWGGAE
ncbi:hypothetical protein Leryth_027074 [Lithospermum erythrorhizon]|nr:hypothetical protein Leryth_027074 [Lithospermum erythrorhizon]